uniref:Immediate early response 2 n=1 Tax=Anolis carolinensis TaxID=28377 RepID=A0A803TNG0_ANOCA
MEVQKEAQRIMTMSVWKMYHSRMQRGGLRLHRSLQLSLVMRSARDLYLSAKLEDDDEAMVNSSGRFAAPPPPGWEGALSSGPTPPLLSSEGKHSGLFLCAGENLPTAFGFPVSV